MWDLKVDCENLDMGLTSDFELSRISGKNWGERVYPLLALTLGVNVLT